MADLFFYGTLRYLPLLETVLGRPVEGYQICDAVLYGYEQARLKAENYPALRRNPEASASGIFVPGITNEEFERLSFYEGPHEYRADPVEILINDASVPALAFQIKDETTISGDPWRFADWVDAYSAMALRVAEDVMLAFDRQTSDRIHWQTPSALSRASSYLRASEVTGRSDGLRRRPEPSDIEILGKSSPYEGFFSIEDITLRHRCFNGEMSPILKRTAFVSVDAVTVLPFDPKRRRVLLIEQFRTGPFARGDRNPWSLEAIAGRVDAGETPMQAALREAQEEAGIQIDRLIPVSSYYPTPGAVTEYLYSFIGLCDLPDGCAGLGGHMDEGEDIRAHLLEFDEFRNLVTDGARLDALCFDPLRAIHSL